MSEFHFLRPLALLLLPLWFLLVWLYWRRGGEAGGWARVVDASLQPHVLTEGGTRRSRPGLILALLGGGLGIAALAGPSWERLPQPVFQDRSALVVVLDLSRSMQAQDIKPSRLERLRFLLHDLLRARTSGQTALVVYAAEAFVVTPLTEDRRTIEALSGRAMLNPAIMPAQGSRPDRALDKAVALLQQAGAVTGDILLLTDGPGSAELSPVLEKLRQQGYRLHVLGVGTEAGAPIPLEGGFLKDAAGQVVVPRLQPGPLRELAEQGGGRYFSLAETEADIAALLEAFGDQPGLRGEGPRMAERWQDRGPWLLLALLPLAALAFRRGVLFLLPLLVLPLGEPVQAGWDDWWRTPDQQAQTRLQAGDWQAAAERFSDPLRKAQAYYAGRDYPAALQALEGLDSAESHFLRGNALARQGQYAEALAAYDQALQKRPGWTEARENREQVERLMPPPQQSQTEQKGEQQEPSEQPQEGKGEDRPGKSENAESASSGETREPGQDQAEQDEQAAGVPQQTDQPLPSGQPGEEGQQGQESDMAQGMEADERWLQRIEDDPAGLMRRKFLYQYQQRRTQKEEETW